MSQRVYVVGFTGTRQGMTVVQERMLRDTLVRLPAHEIHHGCCVGADEQAAWIAAELRLRIMEHPPDNENWLSGNLPEPVYVHDPLPYIERNHKIVEMTELLVACPGENREPLKKRGGGTWATIRYAKNHRGEGKGVIILFPNGSMQSFP